MKPFYKICLIAGSSMLGIGLLTAAAGWTLGGAFEAFGSDMEYDAEYVTSNVVTAEEYEYDGFYDFSGREWEISSVRIECGTADISIYEGKGLTIEIWNDIPKNVICEIDGGELLIQDMTSEETCPAITITVPEDFETEELYLSAAEGTVYLDAPITVKRAEIITGAGEMYLNNLRALESAFYEVGAGELNSYELYANNLSLKCGRGSASLSGEITGESEIECGRGSVYVTSSLDAEEYNYEIERGSGIVSIDDQFFDGFGNMVTIENGAEHSFELICGTGEVMIWTGDY